MVTSPEPAPVRIGCSGWVYSHWRGLFYPDGRPVKRGFAFCADQFDWVEINNAPIVGSRSNFSALCARWLHRTEAERRSCP